MCFPAYQWQFYKKHDSFIKNIFTRRHNLTNKYISVSSTNQACMQSVKYLIYPKYSGTLTPYHTCSKIWTSTIYYPLLCLKIAGLVASYLGLHCLRVHTVCSVLSIQILVVYKLDMWSALILQLYFVCVCGGIEGWLEKDIHKFWF